ncbi:coiled-coil domain-containing protein-domain-containing protein [Xylogone sp. PMI_703]|nr:coiled-coil domain-containing protein-domain-containing protein [Xylogone sp. PMI_703]
MPHKQDSRTEEEIRASEQEEYERSVRIRIKNRRKEYLDRHPSYFESRDLELLDPLLYDRCVRRFLSAAEREADGRAKGWSGILEADLYRSEAKLAALAGQNPGGQNSTSSSSVSFVSYARGKNGEILPEDPDEIPTNKEEGLERWKSAMTIKFLKGEDPDFPYHEVDNNEELDAIEQREAEERWFDDEEPEWVGDDDSGEKTIGGETGIQDF